MLRRRVLILVAALAAVALGLLALPIVRTAVSVRAPLDENDPGGERRNEPPSENKAAGGAMTTAVPRAPLEMAPPDARFVGAEACGECHSDRFESFRHTAHHLTSRRPSEATILGSFSPGENVMTTRNPNLRFVMRAEDDGLYQVAELAENGQTHRRRGRFDIVVGSGKIGQSYLHWDGVRLYQLPVSYFREADRWMNSPGYADGEAFFERPVLGRCLECHATYFQALSDGANSYSPDEFVLGVSCEKCHGPGSEHVAYHRVHPEQTTSRHILFPAGLDRQRLLDVCAQCHSGLGTARRPAFSFRPGQPLEDYLELEDHSSQNRFGVHSVNQLPRLAKSRCFTENQSLTCISCHDPHQLERGELALFSKRCLECHEARDCGMEPQLAARITTNCIDCHMPKRRDKGTMLASSSVNAYPMMRDHFITIYPADTERVLASWNVGAGPSIGGPSTKGSSPLAARLEHGLPIPEDAFDTKTEPGLFRTTVQTVVRSTVDDMARFYRGELAMWGWQESNDALPRGPAEARLQFRDGQGILEIALKRNGAQVFATLVHRRTSDAEAAGLLPDKGHARVILGNSSQDSIVLVIDGQRHTIAAGQGARNPLDAISIQLPPGSRQVTVPGIGEWEIELAEGEIWGLMFTPAKELIAMQAY